MFMKRLIPWLLVLFFMAPAMAAGADEDKPEAAPPPPPSVFVTHHQGAFNGTSVRYLATAGETYLKDADGNPLAAIWSTAYTQEGAADPARPVAFVFNGGPGSASVWLHMGLLGPVRAKVASNADKDDGAAPYPLVANAETPLDVTDLVFIDPVGTGFSRVIGKGKGEDYWSLNGDAASIAEFIRTWITVNHRWNSPKYIIGESFGTTRAAAVSKLLLEGGQDVALNGLVLISQALDYEGSTPIADNIIAYVNYLPSLAAVAHYHGKAGQGKALEAFVAEAEAFALDEYAPALFKGARLTAAEREHIAERLVYFTGLSKDYVLKADLKVLAWRFLKELMRNEGLALGFLDGRFAAEDPDLTADSPTLGDAADFFISSAFTAGANAYFASDLKVSLDRPYLTGSDEAYEHWNWRPGPSDSYWEPAYVNTAPDLALAMRKNAAMRVLFAAGYYDMVCPFFDTDYTIGRHGIVTEHVTTDYFEAGHMMYLHDEDRVKLLHAIHAFLLAK
jgi:carboxypeptidase C (cathepsin A)